MYLIENVLPIFIRLLMLILSVDFVMWYVLLFTLLLLERSCELSLTFDR